MSLTFKCDFKNNHSCKIINYIVAVVSKNNKKHPAPCSGKDGSQSGWWLTQSEKNVKFIFVSACVFRRINRSEDLPAKVAHVFSAITFLLEITDLNQNVSDESYMVSPAITLIVTFRSQKIRLVWMCACTVSVVPILDIIIHSWA